MNPGCQSLHFGPGCCLIRRGDSQHLVDAVLVEPFMNVLVELDLLGAPARRAVRPRQKITLQPARELSDSYQRLASRG